MFAVSSSRHPFPTEIKYLSVEQQDHQSEAQAVNGVDYLGFGMAGHVRGAGPGIGTPGTRRRHFDDRAFAAPGWLWLLVALARSGSVRRLTR
ncbi:hypothetical protein BBK14_18000 [Parafrankia soli]|uniref:Uncharacterized protein n=1 Tax=Parafrankia soli TaxID=2599596 RepID=A0A1S1Q4N4_9ACTN|nr:hypothetical protein BBK14_18000 [Parafrankia soli]